MIIWSENPLEVGKIYNLEIYDKDLKVNPATFQVMCMATHEEYINDCRNNGYTGQLISSKVIAYFYKISLD